MGNTPKLYQLNGDNMQYEIENHMVINNEDLLDGEPTGINGLFDDEEKPLPRARKKAQRITKPALGILTALKFIAVAQKRTGDIQTTHCFISGGVIVASNGEITLSVQIDEDFNACPHTFKLIDALSKCNEGLSITSSGSYLSIVSGDYKAVIPCVEPHQIKLPNPNPNIAMINNSIRDAMKALEPIAEVISVPIYGAVCLQANSAVATNGHVVLEYWHGIDLPPNLCIPKATAKLIGKIKRYLSGFGYNEDSITLYYEDGAILHSKLLGGKFPENYIEAITPPDKPWITVPDEFFAALKAVLPFAEESQVTFRDGSIFSQSSETLSSAYQLKGFTDDINITFNGKYLARLAPAFKYVIFDMVEISLYCQAENIRGALMGINMSIPPKTINADFSNNIKSLPSDYFDDDIPF